MKKILLALLFAVTLTGCDFMNTEVKGYFKEYTETAAGELSQVQTYYVTDSEGYFNVPSDRDCSVNCYLRNPQLYYFGDKDTETVNTVTLIYNGTDAELSNHLLEKTFPVTFTQKALATETINVTIPADFLNYIETYINAEGREYSLSDKKDISFTYTMVEPKSGRKFSGATIKIRANSEPMAVKNLTVMRTDDDKPVYVLAFNMPDMTGIHKDISEITISSNGSAAEGFTVTPEKGVAAATGIATDNVKFLDLTTAAAQVVATEEANSFAGEASGRVVYFKSAESVSAYSEDNPCEFTVTLKDKIGLTAASSASAFSLHLNDVTTDPADLSGLVANEDTDGYSHFKIIAPQDTTYTYTKKDGSTISRTVDPSKITVYYIVYDASGKVTKQGSGLNQVDVALGSGKWTVEAWAHYAGFIDSKTISSKATATGAVYVDQSYTGDISDGGRLTPFNTFRSAFAQICNSGFDSVQISLLSDYEMPEGESFKLSAFGYTGSLIVDGKSKYAINRFTAENGNNIELKDMSPSELNVEKGAKLVLSGAACPAVITVADDAVVYIKNLTERTEASTKVNVQTTTPKYGWNVISSYDNSSYKPAEKEIYYFELQCPGYFINAEANDFGSYDGTVRVSGIGVKTPSSDGLCVMLYRKNDSAEESQLAEGAALKKDEVIYAKVCKYDEASGVYALLGEQKITLIGVYDQGSPVDVTSEYNAENGYKVPAVKITGNYTVEVHFEYENLEYSAQTSVKVEAE